MVKQLLLNCFVLKSDKAGLKAVQLQQVRSGPGDILLWEFKFTYGKHDD